MFDKELIDMIVNLKVDGKALNILIDTILDNCRLGYDEESLVINNDEAVFSVIKAFRPDEYNNRLAWLKAEKKAKLKAEEA